MTLTALVAAYGGDGQGLYALRPLAGATLIEHQVRRLAAAGVTRVVLLVDDWPPALAAPFSRLRADGITIDAVRGLADGVDRLVADARVLILADSCLPDRALLDRMVASPVPALAVLPDSPDFGAFERIDATARWAGVATLDGRRVAEAAAMLGEWDPVSVMLRRAVQESAARIAAGYPPLLADRADLVRVAEAGLVAASREAPAGWSDRFVVLPIVDAALPAFFAKHVEPWWPAIAAVAAAAIGGLAGLFGWRWPALVALLVAAPLARMATRLASVQARALPLARPLRLAPLAGLALAGIGVARVAAGQSRQWGWWLVAAAAIVALLALAGQRRLLAWIGEAEEPAWLARHRDLPWLMLPFAVAGLWTGSAWGAGLAAIAGYAWLSFGWTMRRGLQRAGVIATRVRAG